MSRNPLHDVAIVGVYNTRQEKVMEGVRELDLLVDAIQGALGSAGLRASDIDGATMRGTSSGFYTRSAATLLGSRSIWIGTGYGIEALIEAAGAIAMGQCETVLLAEAQVGEYTERESTSPWTRPSNEFVECWGLYTAAEFALIAQRHMHLYGTKPEALAEVAASIRSNGARNPEAVMYGRECTPEDVLASRMVASPYHLLDCALNTEGGAAIILTTRERAKDLDATPAYILGGATDRMGMSYVRPPVWDTYGRVGSEAARKCFSQSGLGPSDVDVCEFYDPFSFEIIRQFEAYGFCKEGEGGDFVMGGRIRTGGELPVVTGGGLLSYSHAGTAQLLQKVIACVLQLQGRYPEELTVPGAKVAMTSNGGAGALFTDVMLIGKEPA